MKAAILCHFASQNMSERAGTLLLSIKVLNANSLARLLNQSKLVDPKAVWSCPAYLGGIVEIIFANQLQETKVSIETSGCVFVKSDHASGGWFLSGPARLALAKIDHTIWAENK
jgi:hypothetical protein